MEAFPGSTARNLAVDPDETYLKHREPPRAAAVHGQPVPCVPGATPG
jgi:hypothetical protein